MLYVVCNYANLVFIPLTERLEFCVVKKFSILFKMVCFMLLVTIIEHFYFFLVINLVKTFANAVLSVSLSRLNDKCSVTCDGF